MNHYPKFCHLKLFSSGQGPDAYINEDQLEIMLERLGSGAFASVFKGRYLSDEVAVKIPHNPRTARYVKHKLLEMA